MKLLLKEKEDEDGEVVRLSGGYGDIFRYKKSN